MLNHGLSEALAATAKQYHNDTHIAKHILRIMSKCSNSKWELH